MTDNIDFYTIDELMAVCMAQSIIDGTTVFNGVSVPLPFAAITLARKTHAKNCIFYGGLLAGLNPDPCFLPPTSGDSSILVGAHPILHLSQIFELAMRGELDRIFFSGAQIDKYGNLNNTLIGSADNIKLKLPGGAGASHISAFAKNFTIWSVRHDAAVSNNRKVLTFVDEVDFITTMGMRNRYGTRKELELKGGGPDIVITNLCVFDFDEDTDVMRIKSIHPGHTLEEVLANTGFDPVIPASIETTKPPSRREVEIIRSLDPLNTRKRGFSDSALNEKYSLSD